MIQFEAGDFANPKDGAAGYPAEEIRRVLRASSRMVRYRMYVMTGGNIRIGTVPFWDGRLDVSANASVTRSLALSMLTEDAERIGPTHRLQPAMQLRMPDGGFFEWPLGVFLPTSPVRFSTETGRRYCDMEAYDQAVVLRDDLLLSPLTVPEGTKYLEAAYQQLQAVGVTRLLEDDLGTSTAEDLQFAPGTSRLEIVNAFLTAINYRDVWFDEYGFARFTLYQPAYGRRINHLYAADELSVTTPAIRAARDEFGVPNVILCVASRAEGVLYARWENTNAASPLSIPRRGRRVVRRVDVDNIVDQATLDEYALRLGNQLSAVADEVQFETLCMPGHGAWDVLQLSIPEASGRYEEVAWGMDLTTDGRMRHTARKVVLI
jgi:hypothetical protein